MLGFIASLKCILYQNFMYLFILVVTKDNAFISSGIPSIVFEFSNLFIIVYSDCVVYRLCLYPKCTKCVQI